MLGHVKPDAQHVCLICFMIESVVEKLAAIDVKGPNRITIIRM
jgi:hypothetical protein